MDVEIPWELVEEERKRLVKSIRKTAVVPGFRQGKAPQAVLNRHFEPGILEAMQDSFIPQYVVHQVNKRDVEVASGPYLGSMHFAEGEPLKVQVEFEVFPKFELGEYRGLQIPSFDVKVTDEMVDQYLENLRLQNASYQNLDPRPIANGDIAIANLKGYLDDGTEVFDREDTHFEVGTEKAVPEATSALLGRVPGDTVEFQITLSNDHRDKNLAGQNVTNRLEITGLTKRELPDLDDEFAKDIDDNADSLEDLKSSIRDRMEGTFAEDAERQEVDRVCRLLAAAHPMELPTAYMLERYSNALADFKRQNGLGADDTLPREPAGQLFHAEEVRVRSELVLDRIAMVEGISVSESEIEEQVRRYAQSEQVTLQRAYDTLKETGMLSTIEQRCRRGKVISLVVAEANRSAPEESAPSDGTTEPHADAETADQGVLDARAG